MSVVFATWKGPFPRSVDAPNRLVKLAYIVSIFAIACLSGCATKRTKTSPTPSVAVVRIPVEKAVRSTDNAKAKVVSAKASVSQSRAAVKAATNAAEFQASIDFLETTLESAENDLLSALAELDSTKESLNTAVSNGDALQKQIERQADDLAKETFRADQEHQKRMVTQAAYHRLKLICAIIVGVLVGLYSLRFLPFLTLAPWLQIAAPFVAGGLGFAAVFFLL